MRLTQGGPSVAQGRWQGRNDPGAMPSQGHANAELLADPPKNAIAEVDIQGARCGEEPGLPNERLSHEARAVWNVSGGRVSRARGNKSVPD